MSGDRGSPRGAGGPPLPSRPAAEGAGLGSLAAPPPEESGPGRPLRLRAAPPPESGSAAAREARRGASGTCGVPPAAVLAEAPAEYS